MESKFLNQKKNAKKKPSFIVRLFTKVLICLIIFLSFLIVVKANPKLKNKINDILYTNNISFASFNNWYKKNFGNIIPLDSNVVKEEAVFNEKLSYSKSSTYKDGVKLTVGSNYLVPILESGVVVFKGEKEGYGNVVIVQQINGVDTWYGNVSTSYELYDYIEKGELLGEANGEEIYLVFQKDGKVQNYKEYI